MEGRTVLVAELADKSTLARVVRAALHHEILHVPLSAAPNGQDLYTLQLRAPGSPGVSLSAEPMGEREARGFPFRLSPLDPSHVPELHALLVEDGPPSSLAPVSKGASAIFDSAPPLPSGPKRGRLDTKTDEYVSALDDGDTLGESVLFDPEQAIISLVPSGVPRTEDDELTVPFRGSAPPPPPSTRAQSMAPPTTTKDGAPSPADASEPSLSVLVDFDEPSLQGERSDGRDWKKTDPDARNLLGSRPDREGSGAAPHPSDGDGISAVFGTEPTVPGEMVGDRRRPASVIVHGRDGSLTIPTPVMSMVPITTEDADTLQRASQATPSVALSKRGPRTPKRMQAIVGAGRMIANKYRVESLIGTGAVGAVYKASHADLARAVAIKVLHPHCRSDPQLMAAFRAEARAASLLDHPSVTIVHDFGEEPDGLVYIVMEFLPGTTLQTVLDEQLRLPGKRAIHIMLQVAAALSAAHERGIVHRDVKPDNILLVQTRDDEGFPFELAKVCDFGIAALEAGPDPSDGEFTAGTPEYMAPEQAHGRTDVRTDIYACGIVLFEMLTGLPPFLGQTVNEILYKHASEAVPRLTRFVIPGENQREGVLEVDARLEALVLRALEKLPDRRFSTMREMRQALKRLL